VLLCRRGEERTAHGEDGGAVVEEGGGGDGSRTTTDEGAAPRRGRAQDTAGARPCEGAACLVGSHAGARSSMPGCGEDEDGGADS